MKQQIGPLVKELVSLDKETLGLYSKAIEQQVRCNELSQRLTEWVTEGQYLAKRFGLNGSGLRTAGRPNFHDSSQRFGLLSLFTPEAPAEFSDAIRELNRERNQEDKIQRREQQGQQPKVVSMAS